MNTVSWIILSVIVVAVAIALFFIIKSKGKTCGCCSKNCPMKALNKKKIKSVKETL